MTVLEKGKFVKNFVRVDKDGKLVKVPHSNFRGYSVQDMEQIEPQIDDSYWDNWEHFLTDKHNDEKLMAEYSDWQHYLYQLNGIDDEDIKKYDLPTDYIVIKPITTKQDTDD